MTANAQSNTGKSAIWTGRVLSGLIVAFMLFDAGVKLAKAAPAVEGTARLGYPVWELVPIGIAALACAILYAVPRTAVLGAILLTGYLGGATATQVRMQDPWFVMPVILGMIAWCGLYLRDESLRRLIPIAR
jgi:DoxX-like family